MRESINKLAIKHEKKKRELIEKMELCRKCRNDIILFTNDLRKQYNKGIVDELEYKQNLYNKLNGKEPEEWIRYYDDYIGLCRKEIGRIEADQQIWIKNLGIVVVLVFLMFGATFLGKVYTAGAVLENAEIFAGKDAYKVGDMTHLYIVPANADYDIEVYDPDNELYANALNFPVEKTGTYNVRAVLSKGNETKIVSAQFEVVEEEKPLAENATIENLTSEIPGNEALTANETAIPFIDETENMTAINITIEKLQQDIANATAAAEDDMTAPAAFSAPTDTEDISEAAGAIPHFIMNDTEFNQNDIKETYEEDEEKKIIPIVNAEKDGIKLKIRGAKKNKVGKIWFRNDTLHIDSVNIKDANVQIPHRPLKGVSIAPKLYVKEDNDQGFMEAKPYERNNRIFNRLFITPTHYEFNVEHFTDYYIVSFDSGGSFDTLQQCLFFLNNSADSCFLQAGAIPPIYSAAENETVFWGSERGNITNTAYYNLSGAIAAYNFEEGSGNWANDTTGQLKILNFTNITNSHWLGGKWGNAVFFNRTSYGIITDHPDFNFSLEMSVEYFVFPTNPNGVHIHVVRGTNANTRQFSLAEASGSIIFATRNQSSSTFPLQNCNGGVLLTNHWNHVAATYNGSEKKVYVNGILTSTCYHNGTLNTPNNNITIGSYYNKLVSGMFNGSIDSLIIYNRTLSPEEVYNHSIGRLPIYQLGGVSSSAIQISEDNTILDCNQTKIIPFQSGSIGIGTPFIPPQSATIKNCILGDFGTGISLSNPANVVIAVLGWNIINVNMTGVGIGISLSNFTNVTIKDVNITGATGYVIDSSQGTNLSIYNFYGRNNFGGIHLDSTDTTDIDNILLSGIDMGNTSNTHPIWIEEIDGAVIQNSALGTAVGGSNNLIQIDSSKNINITNMTGLGSDAHGIAEQGSSTDFFFDSLNISNTKNEMFTIGCGSDSYNYTVRNSVFHNSSNNDCLSLCAYRVNVINNTISNCQRAAIYFATNSNRITDAQIENNTLKDSAFNILLFQTYNVTIRNNILLNSTNMTFIGASFGLGSGSITMLAATNVTIINNTINGSASAGIYVNRSSINISIINNTILNTGGTNNSIHLPTLFNSSLSPRTKDSLNYSDNGYYIVTSNNPQDNTSCTLTSITTDRAQVSAYGVDGTMNWSLALDNATSAGIKATVFTNFSNETDLDSCVDNAAGGTTNVDHFEPNVWITNGINNNYTMNFNSSTSIIIGNTDPSWVAAFIKFSTATNSSIVVDGTDPSIGTSTSGIDITGNVIYNPDRATNLSIWISNAGNTRVWLNNLYSGGVHDDNAPLSGAYSYCVGNEGNFYEEKITSLGTGDCGQANVSYPTTGEIFNQSSTIKSNWTKQSSQIPVNYQLFANNTRTGTKTNIGTTTSLTLNLLGGTLKAGNYTLFIIPYVNGSRINATHAEGQNFTINNTAPTITSVLLNSTSSNNFTSDNLTATPFGASDPQADSITFNYNWLKNGISDTVLNMPMTAPDDLNRTYDLSGNNMHGNIINATWNSTAGQDGFGAYEFDGDKDNIQISDQSYFSPANNNLSISFWAMVPNLSKPTGSGERGSAGAYFIGKGGGDWEYEWAVENDNNGLLAAIVWDVGGGEWLGCQYTVAINDSLWHNYVFVINNSNGAGSGVNGIGLYRDGVSVCTDTTTGVTAPGDNISKVYIGQRGDGNYFNGTMDDVRIYNRTLSLNEIKLLYENKTNVTHFDATAKHDNWTVKVTPIDSYGLNGSSVFSNMVNITNSVPGNVTLVDPANNNLTLFNRTPTFNWTATTDNDNEALTYTLNITQSTCPSILVAGITATGYPITQNLCLDSIYNWSVYASDGEANSTGQDIWGFKVASSLIMTLTNSTVDFGSVIINNEYNTSYEGSPNPFVIQNDGNAVSDVVTISANKSLWTDAGLNTTYFQFKANNRTTEIGAFNWSNSTAIFTNVKNVSLENTTVISQLNWTDSKDNAEIDIRILVPPAEPAGAKYTNIVITGAVSG